MRRIIVFDEKGWLKLPIGEDNEVYELLKRRYGKYADVLIEAIKLFQKFRLESITIEVNGCEFFITYE